ncbi:replicative helicase loader/inhibitor [Neobacillus sp. SAB-20_R2A]|uniref:replicative helicase loader/inhibitor n=1 Tax=Neobacillus sp. SAB-20_R2A TaxID=3120519 RepID=UPI003C6DEAE6
MMKRETFELLKAINTFYDQFIVNQEKVNLWHEVLKGYAYDIVQERLFSFVKESPYPPKIADLLPKSSGAMTVPNTSETRVIMAARHKLASEEVIQRELANMRAILGIQR